MQGLETSLTSLLLHVRDGGTEIQKGKDLPKCETGISRMVLAGRRS